MLFSLAIYSSTRVLATWHRQPQAHAISTAVGQLRLLLLTSTAADVALPPFMPNYTQCMSMLVWCLRLRSLLCAAAGRALVPLPVCTLALHAAVPIFVTLAAATTHQLLHHSTTSAPAPWHSATHSAAAFNTSLRACCCCCCNSCLYSCSRTRSYWRLRTRRTTPTCCCCCSTRPASCPAAAAAAAAARRSHCCPRHLH
jgi:hypothetical protein